jgi:hypothetical protein
MRDVLFIVALVLGLAPFAAVAKHPAPPQVGAVTNNGVRYVVPNDKGLRAYVEAWDAQTGKKLWAKTIFRHYYIRPFGTECMHFEYLRSMVLQDGTLILTSDRERIFSLGTRSKAVRRLKAKEPNHPVAGKAGFASLLTVGHHWPGLPEPGRYRDMKLHSLLLGWRAPAQVLRVAAVC